MAEPQRLPIVDQIEPCLDLGEPIGVGPGQRQMQRVPDDVEPGEDRSGHDTVQLRRRRAVAAHRRLQLDDDPTLPTCQRIDVAQ